MAVMQIRQRENDDRVRSGLKGVDYDCFASKSCRVPIAVSRLRLLTAAATGEAEETSLDTEVGFVEA
jgi:hypothetical protein